MMTLFSRRAFLSSGLSVFGAAACANAPAVSLRPERRPEDFIQRAAPGVERLIAEAQLGGEVSFSVMDVKTGLTLEEREARDGQPPASVTKAVTALYALDTLGGGYRFKTQLIATGPVEGGVLKGDLILAGGGDPTLDTDALAEMAAALKAKGVREVRGQFRTWGGALPFEKVIDAGQPAHVGYNPSISGLNLNYNRVHFEWRRGGDGYQVTMDARSARYRPEVRVARMVISTRSSPVYTYKDRGEYDSWTVARGALGGRGARWLPVRKPAAYAGEVFAVFARSQGIVLKDGGELRQTPKGTALVTHQSAPLRDVLRGMLKYSTNLTAELVGMMATRARNGRVQSLDASAREMSRWARSELGMSGAKLVDHSGLGEASRLSARAMAQALVKVHGARALRPILKDIDLRDGNGRVNRNHPVKVQAKTGTLYFVSSLAGYMTAPDGTELAFAIFTADTGRRAKIDSSVTERPPGARSWNRRAKQLQQKLIERWGMVYGS
ncbi:D-alanyl-D-alanine carboxypeptidase/D-alanyl-D-alanine-endopeptidase [uncultured Roseovarius sp.]|uniref:D-alanyl-D-alanine carboxypeptidase/D-alanyl-D-alanine endopeptidase n=1 Tax=uncultured Roseovarius sp. TaxID=293344 RepID=UPI0025DDBD6E|nr:D-alanyl-D-alanine carboxypeptidase/D-alanyl-D-alanine-endopeptidase [uncultured Roseovarius sp.]